MVFAKVSPVWYEVKDRVAYVTLNRPNKGNALNEEMHQELNRTWHRINEDEDVWVVVLQGAGDDFCVGEDLDEIAEAYRQDTEVQRWRLDDSWQRKYAGHAPTFGWPDPTKGLPGKPMLTVVHGKCHGSGLMFVVNADFSIAADDAEFSLPNVHQGTAPVQEVLSLTNSMLRTPVLRLALLGKYEHWTAERARQLGLIFETYPKDAIADRVDELVDILNNKSSPLCVRGAKAGYWGTIDIPYSLAGKLDHIYKAEVRAASEDSKEGPRAFAEKRRPQWKAR
jgi:enoyl-CoA hydratase/carnithine racemase